MVMPYDGMAPKARFISPARFTNLTAREVAEVERVTSVTPKSSKSSLISGCSDEESSYDAWFAGRANGAFSRVAIDVYVPGMSLAAWAKAIRTQLPSVEYPQTPILTAASLYRRYAKAL
jgi:hypothetical protein